MRASGEASGRPTHAVGLTQRWNSEVFRSLAEGVSRVLAGEVPPNLLNTEAVAGISGGARMER
jgi:hypothetical protein